MTARELQKAIMEDLRELFATDQFKTPDGKMASPGLYPQFLPQLESDDDTDPFPYIIVRIDSGGIETQTDPHKISVILVIGIFEDSLENEGHESVLEIIERIQQHYEETPALKEFVCADPFNWALQDEPSYPYFYGAVNLVFHAPAPRANSYEYKEINPQGGCGAADKICLRRPHHPRRGHAEYGLQRKAEGAGSSHQGSAVHGRSLRPNLQAG